MSNDPTVALAPRFDWTTATTDVTVNSTVVTVATAANRVMWLGPTADAAGQCLIARTLAATNAAITPAVMTATMSTDGKVTFALVGGASFTITWGATLAAILGAMPDAPYGTTSCTGAYPVKHLALCGTIDGADWSPEIAGAAQVTAGGTSYGYTSASGREVDDLAFEWIIRDPTLKATYGDLGTPWHPADADAATINAHACPWSWRDVLRQAVGRTCSLARGNWQTLRTSTTERYDLVSVKPDSLLLPRRDMRAARWLPYHNWSAVVYRHGTAPTGTRA